LVFSADLYRCINAISDEQWFSVEGNAFVYYMEGNAAWAFDAWPDVAYILSFLSTVASLVLYNQIAPHFLWVETARLTVSTWKMVYHLLE
jgi:hypothetical protein